MDNNKALNTKTRAIKMVIPTDEVYRTKSCVDNDKALNTKTRAIKMAILTDEVHRIKNCVDENEVLGVKSPVASKINKAVRKYSLGSDLSGCL